ncbi:hypothetical protein V8E54_000774 [Elaphomyces granulatus]
MNILTSQERRPSSRISPRRSSSSSPTRVTAGLSGASRSLATISSIISAPSRVPQFSSEHFSTTEQRIIRSRVISRDKDCCWVCGLEVALALQFLKYHAAGVIPKSLTHLSYPGNLITLCPTCHTLFDALVPLFVILPTDIQFFIDWEERDYEMRCRAAENSLEVPARTVPTENDYVGNFKVYPLDTSIYKDRTFQAKAWKGSPTAMIMKSALGLFQPVINPGIDTEGRYPLQGQRALVTALMDLYSRTDPKAAEGAGKGPGQEEEGDDKSPGKREQDEDEDEEEKEERVRPSKRRRTRTSKSGHRRSNPPRKAHPSGPYNFKIDVDAPWTLGPWMTTNDTLLALGIQS